jgi:hypothetical protein
VCLYILHQPPDEHAQNHFYKAVYLKRRTVKDLIERIAKACNINPTMVCRAVYAKPNGLNVLIDDDVVCWLPEGQDMRVMFCELGNSAKRIEVERVNVDHSTIQDFNSKVLEMTLLF